MGRDIKQFDSFEDFLKYMNGWLKELNEQQNKPKVTIPPTKEGKLDASKLFTVHHDKNNDKWAIRVIAPFADTNSVNINVISNGEGKGENVVIQYNNIPTDTFFSNFVMDNCVTIKVAIPNYITKKTIKGTYDNGMIIVSFSTMKNKLDSYQVPFKI